MHALDKAGDPIPTLDGMVAAVALEEGARFATRDRKHFERVAGLELVSLP
jgi:predicted nucleic acid-binding protein